MTDLQTKVGSRMVSGRLYYCTSVSTLSTHAVYSFIDGMTERKPTDANRHYDDCILHFAN